MLGLDRKAALDGRQATTLTRADLYVTDPNAVRAALAGYDLVIDAAAAGATTP